MSFLFWFIHFNYNFSESTRRPSELGVAFGSENRMIRSENSLYVRVKRVIIHEKFNYETFQNDVALLIVSLRFFNKKLVNY